MSTPRFRQGRLVKSLGDLERLLEAGRWVYWRDKPLRGWLFCMQFWVVRNAIKKGIVRVAIERQQ